MKCKKCNQTMVKENSGEYYCDYCRPARQDLLRRIDEEGGL